VGRHHCWATSPLGLGFPVSLYIVVLIYAIHQGQTRLGFLLFPLQPPGALSHPAAARSSRLPPEPPPPPGGSSLPGRPLPLARLCTGAAPRSSAQAWLPSLGAAAPSSDGARRGCAWKRTTLFSLDPRRRWRIRQHLPWPPCSYTEHHNSSHVER
jgi:hypothetical protein